MDIRTFRAHSMQDALEQVRDELGPNASVLHTRELRRGPLQWLAGGPRIEVTASATVTVPSRFTERELVTAGNTSSGEGTPQIDTPSSTRNTPSPSRNMVDRIPAADAEDYRERFRLNLRSEQGEPRSLVADLSRSEPQRVSASDAFFKLFTDLIDNELPEELARELVDRVRSNQNPNDTGGAYLKQQAAQILKESIRTSGAIRLHPGHCQRVALVGPTGVGKTTTIAKLAANFHLRDKRRVGMITVDTYRIAAVEQLRTYAEIIDLPMEVVSTPREMRAAVERLSAMDLILLDTAGRSPRDEVKIRELKTMLSEADEVHLVLSSTASTPSLQKTVEQFSQAGVTSLLLTKLDEASGLGGLAPLLRSCQIPISYLTNGQNVPDDISPAQADQLTSLMIGLDETTSH